MRLRRYGAQVHFILFRLRFHIVEGIRFARITPLAAIHERGDALRACKLVGRILRPSCALVLIVGALCHQTSRAQQSAPGATMPMAVSPLLSNDDDQTQQSSSHGASVNAGSNVDSTGADAGEARNSAASLRGDAAAPLSASQILAVLQQQPDALVE